MRGLGATTPAGVVIDEQIATPERIAWCSSGRGSWLTNSKCWNYPLAAWESMNASTYTAAPPAPTPAQLQTDPSATVQALANAEMLRQQQLDSGAVQPVYSPVPDSVLNLPGTIGEAFSNLNPAGWFDSVNWWAVAGVVAIGAFATMTLAHAGPRRYGR